MDKIILLATNFMFQEELGSRLRGIGYSVHSIGGENELNKKINSDEIQVILAIIDLQYKAIGGIMTVKTLIEQKIPVIAIGEHMKPDILNEARKLGVSKVITNSQASKNIENYVKEIIGK